MSASGGVAGGARVDDRLGRRALARERGRAGDGRVRAVGGHEVDQRLGVLEVLPEVRPARVRRQLAVAASRRRSGAARSFSGGTPSLACTGHVDRRQVQRQAQQVVAQGVGHELVELVADLVATMPMTMLPAACSRRAACPPTPPSVYAAGSGSRRAAGCELSLPSSLVRAIVSVSIEWPKR